MRGTRFVLFALLLVAGFRCSTTAWSQEPRGPPFEQTTRGFRLGQNYPNPVNPETWIPFYLEDELFEEGDTGVVTIRIVNLLRQLVAIPVATEHPNGQALPVLNLPYTTAGRKTAYWDGKDTAGRRVPSGVYYCELTVNDQSTFRKMVVVRRRKRPYFIPWFSGGDRSG